MYVSLKTVLHRPKDVRSSEQIDTADCDKLYMGAEKSLARPCRKQVTEAEDFDIHISYLLSYLEEY